MKTTPALSTARKHPKSKEPSAFMALMEKIFHNISKFSFSIILLLLALLFWCLFKHYYYEKNAVFMIAPEQIVIRGNSVYDRELLLTNLGLLEAKNGFHIVLSDVVERLQRDMPALKDVQMIFEPGKQLEIWVVERTPIARLARPTVPGEFWPALAVDDEGAIFMYPRSLSAYPEIGDQEYAKMAEPGERLPPYLRCMLHVILATNELAKEITSDNRPGSIRKITQLSHDSEDGLNILLFDGRRIAIAWPGMSTEEGISEEMVTRLKHVARLLKDPLLIGKKHFNAMAPDRVAVSD